MNNNNCHLSERTSEGCQKDILFGSNDIITQIHELKNAKYWAKANNRLIEAPECIYSIELPDYDRALDINQIPEPIPEGKCAKYTCKESIKGATCALSEYKNSVLKDISSVPSIPQFRKIASIIGEYTLDDNDLGIHHNDSIGVFASFYKSGDVYEIPFGCLYSNKVSNLFAAGRIISSDNEAWEVIRVIPVGILTGEVAGIASNLFLKKELDINRLQSRLLKKGFKLHF